MLRAYMIHVFYFRDLFDVSVIFYISFITCCVSSIFFFFKKRVFYIFRTLCTSHFTTGRTSYRSVINSCHVPEHEMRFSHSVISASVLSSRFCL